MQWKGGQDTEHCRAGARRSGGIAHLCPCTFSAATRGDGLDFREGRMTLSCSRCTFPLTDLSLRERELYSQHPEVPGRGGSRTTVTFWLGPNTLNKSLLEVEG